MARALWLADVLRGAGLPVVEVPGWRERGRSTFYPRGIICHATAGSRTATDQGEINVLLNGSASAPPPIAQLYLSRSGTWHVVASGACNHCLVGWAGPHRGFGNRELLGVEAANDNGRDAPRVPAEPWPAVQLDSYARGVAAISRHAGWPVGRVAGHKEHQPYPPPPGSTSTKSDPTFDMPTFRAHVTGAPSTGDDDMDAEQNRKLVNVDAVEYFGGVLGQTTIPGVVLPGRAPTTARYVLGERVKAAADGVAELLARPAGSVALTPEDRDAIVAGLLAGLRPVVREEVAARFADAGQVDPA